MWLLKTNSIRKHILRLTKNLILPFNLELISSILEKKNIEFNKVPKYKFLDKITELIQTAEWNYSTYWITRNLIPNNYIFIPPQDSSNSNIALVSTKILKENGAQVTGLDKTIYTFSENSILCLARKVNQAKTLS